MESLPYDIHEDILIHLPLKSLLACILVCKKWKTMICAEYFKTRYLALSMTRPMVHSTPDSLFHSICRERYEYAVCAPIRGWICVQTLTTLSLYNPITNELLHLPFLVGHGRRYHPDTCIFGYDEANGVFKVLGFFSSSFVVYTVRSDGEGSWRSIACEHPHTYLYLNLESDPPLSLTNALCKGGVLYYAAIIDSELTTIIMSFDLSSEEFTVNQLPEGFKVNYDSTIVNYNGKVALVTNSQYDNGEFQICVRNEVSGQWELQRVVIPGWRDKVGNDRFFSFVGTIGTGDLVFKGSESVMHYNTNPPQRRKKFEMYKIEADNGGSYLYVRASLNHFYPLLPTNQGGTNSIV